MLRPRNELCGSPQRMRTRPAQRMFRDACLGSFYSCSSVNVRCRVSQDTNWSQETKTSCSTLDSRSMHGNADWEGGISGSHISCIFCTRYCPAVRTRPFDAHHIILQGWMDVTTTPLVMKWPLRRCRAITMKIPLVKTW